MDKSLHTLITDNCNKVDVVTYEGNIFPYLKQGCRHFNKCVPVIWQNKQKIKELYNEHNRLCLQLEIVRCLWRISGRPRHHCRISEACICRDYE